MGKDSPLWNTWLYKGYYYMSLVTLCKHSLFANDYTRFFFKYFTQRLNSYGIAVVSGWFSELVPFTNMSTLSYRTECTIMSLAAAIQVMWVLQIPTWESKCGSQTTQPSQAAKVRPHPVRRTTEDSSQFVSISMWPRFLAVQMQYGGSPWETT